MSLNKYVNFISNIYKKNSTIICCGMFVLAMYFVGIAFKINKIFSFSLTAAAYLGILGAINVYISIIIYMYEFIMIIARKEKVKFSFRRYEKFLVLLSVQIIFYLMILPYKELTDRFWVYSFGLTLIFIGLWVVFGIISAVYNFFRKSKGKSV